MIRLEMNKKQEAILAAIILIASLGVFILYSGIGRPAEPEPEPEPVAEAEPPPPTVAETVAQHIEHYDFVDASFLQELGDGSYTFDNPLIVVNPYGSSPLTALVMFQSDAVLMVDVTVNGKTPDVSVTHRYFATDKNHIVPVYGLYPGMVNLVEISAEPRWVGGDDASYGQDYSVSFLIETAGMPEWFPVNLPKMEVSDIEKVSSVPSALSGPPFFFTFVRLSAFDIYGDYRWCYTGFGTGYPTDYTDSGNVQMIVGSFDNEDAMLLDINLLGRIVSAEPIYDESEFSGFGIHHTVRMPLG